MINKLFKIFIRKLKEKKLQRFGSIYKGLVATGDHFISDKKTLQKLSSEIKGLLAVEMGEQHLLKWLNKKV